MIDRWEPDAGFASPLEECVYGSRLLGADPALVLHGGGNTSVKATGRDVLGEPIDILYVKGSGHDLSTITSAGFVPLDLKRVARLADFEQMTDAGMMRALRVLRLDPARPDPSVEAVLHALIPVPSVLHTHADAVLAVTNTSGGRQRASEAFGDNVIVVDYIMPGFPLAKLCAGMIRRHFDRATAAIVLLKHGIFTFGPSTADAYRSMIAMVTRAETYLSEMGDRRRAHARPIPSPAPKAENGALADLRSAISHAAGRPMLLARCTTERAVGFAGRADLASVTSRGPATPDHVLRTKRVPLVGRDVAAYAREYQRYFQANAARHPAALTMLDPAPRIVIDPQLGLLTAGRTVKELQIALDIYLHTIDVIEGAEDLGGYQPIEPGECFDVEYWDLEQAKLKLQGPPPPFAGEVAIVTGAASGIGRATAEALLADGAAVIGVDVSPAAEPFRATPAYIHVRGDVVDRATAHQAIDAAANGFGGLDVLVMAAGMFPAGAAIADQDLDAWRRSIDVNLNGGLVFLQASHPLLSRSPAGGRVVIVGSKNVHAPGPGAGAYSASKAGLNQIGRIAALEWASDGIRVNTVHPDAVFDTGLWSPELIAARAASYRLTPEAYRSRNLLSVEVRARDVAALIVALCSDTFSKTTGAQIPIDGGNARTI